MDMPLHRYPQPVLGTGRDGHPGFAQVYSTWNCATTRICSRAVSAAGGAGYPRPGRQTGRRCTCTTTPSTPASKSAVVDWYYKRGSVLRTMPKIVNGVVLYASRGRSRRARDEDSMTTASIPLCSTRCSPCEGAPAGFGYLDVCKERADVHRPARSGDPQKRDHGLRARAGSCGRMAL